MAFAGELQFERVGEKTDMFREYPMHSMVYGG